MKYKLSPNCKTKLFEGNVESSLPTVNHPELHKLKRNKILHITTMSSNTISLYWGEKKKSLDFPKNFTHIDLLSQVSQKIITSHILQ